MITKKEWDYYSIDKQDKLSEEAFSYRQCEKCLNYIDLGGNNEENAEGMYLDSYLFDCSEKNIIDALKDQFDKSKITYIVGDFSGGHDEGGFDEIKFTDKNDNEIKPESLQTHWVNQYKLFKHDNKKQIAYFYQEYATSVDLNDASQLESLMWQTGALNQFGSFAGEYSVNGSVKLDLNTKKYILDGSQTIEEYDELYEEGEVV